jgi:hypothetical protein
MPFSTKTFEMQIPRVNIPTRAIRSIVIPDGTTPPPVKKLSQYLAEFKPSSNTKTSDSRRLFIDVQPDMRYVQLFINTFCVSIYTNLDFKNHPDITPASISSYCMIVFHFFFLACDKFYRKPNSPACIHFFQSDSRRDLFHDALEMIVPDFLGDYLKYFMPANDPRRPDIMYIPTYASFSWYHDFGRFIPASFMLSAHNIFASVRQNQPAPNIFHHWTKVPLIISTDDGTPYFRNSNIIGCNYTAPANQQQPDWTRHFYDNWFFNQIHALINPIIVRTLSQRYVFDEVALHPFDINNVTDLIPEPSGIESDPNEILHLNPYIYGTMSNLDTLGTTQRFIQSMSQHFENVYAGLSSLGKILQFDSGDSILKHGYHGPALPTWSSRLDNTAFDFFSETNNALIRITARQLANGIYFLSDRQFEAGTQPLNTVIPMNDDNTNTAKGFLAWNYLLFSTKMSDKKTDPTKYVHFDSSIHVTPEIRILCPFDANPSEGHEPQITGRLIECAEIDGFSIPYPDTRITLSAENSITLSSAVSLRFIQRANHTPTTVHHRVLRTPSTTGITINLYDMGQNRLGQIAYDAQLDPNYPPNGNPFGFNLTGPLRWFDLITNKISYVIGLNGQGTTRPPIKDEYIYAWSPYRYRYDVLPSHESEGIYMILDLRTLFGTACPLMSSEHPSVRMPTI